MINCHLTLHICALSVSQLQHQPQALAPHKSQSPLFIVVQLLAPSSLELWLFFAHRMWRQLQRERFTLTSFKFVAKQQSSVCVCFCGIYNWHIQKCPVILTLNCQPLSATSPLPRRFYCMSTPCRATFCPFIYACMVCLSILLALPPSLSLFLCRFLLIFLFFFFKSDNHSPLSGCQVSGRAFVSLYLCVKMTLHTHTVAQLNSFGWLRL